MRSFRSSQYDGEGPEEHAMAESVQEAAEHLTSFGGAVIERVREQPYPVLALAAMAGYVAGGGLFSSFTRPLARAALGALLVPGVRDRLRELSEEFRSSEAAGAA
jgi:hypothetical protein